MWFICFTTEQNREEEKRREEKKGREGEDVVHNEATLLQTELHYELQEGRCIRLTLVATNHCHALMWEVLAALRISIVFGVKHTRLLKNSYKAFVVE